MQLITELYVDLRLEIRRQAGRAAGGRCWLVGERWILMWVIFCDCSIRQYRVVSRHHGLRARLVRDAQSLGKLISLRQRSAACRDKPGPARMSAMRRLVNSSHTAVPAHRSPLASRSWADRLQGSHTWHFVLYTVRRRLTWRLGLLALLTCLAGEGCDLHHLISSTFRPSACR